MAKNKNIVFLVAAVALLLLSGCSTPQQSANEKEIPVLRVYTYDSMVSEYGLLPKVVPKFEEECGCKVEMLAVGDAGQVIFRLALEKNNPRADAVIGIDNSFAAKAIKAGVLEKFTPKNIGLVPENLRFDKEGYLTPYDYGYIAFVYDNEKIKPPHSFEELLDARFEKKIIIENPRTSSPGLALLLWTIAVYGDGYKEYWEKLKPNILTVTAGWDEAAGLFAAGEAPMYLSYATSPPYYAEFEGKTNILAAGFEEGHYLQVEGIGIVKGTKNRALAEKFIEFSLSEGFQKEIPFTQFMFPVNQSTELPQAFELALRPEKPVTLDEGIVEEKQEEWILEWEKILS